MATSITAQLMLAALDKWGIVPKFYKPDWATHNRNAQQGFGPINGFVIHNFGSDTSDPNSLAYLYNGDLARGMPGPLSQFAITDDGTVWVIGWGTANHTGSMAKALHALVVDDKAPLDRDYKPTVRTGDAGSMNGVNPHYLGVEMTYGKAPTSAQRASAVRLAAALMDLLGPGYTGGSVVGHRECTLDRSDPVGVPMGAFRRDVNALLKSGPGRASSDTTTTPAGDDMPITDADAQKIANAVASLAIPNHDPNPGDKTPPATYAAKSYWVMGNWRAADLQNTVAKLRAELAGLSAAVEALAKAQGADASQIAGIVDQAVRDRLAQVRFDVTDSPNA
jgi:hypothetical protein